jgi:phage tail-like protein
MPNPLRESSPEEVFTAFHFAVEINVPGVAPRLCRAAFAECEGLGLIMHARTIREGGNREREIHLLGSRSYGQVTLKRGMTASFDLWNWVDAFLTADHDGLQDTLRSDVEVVLLAPDGRTERARFLLRRCLPVLLKAPTLNAKDGAVAIEELQLVYESLALKRPGVAHPPLPAVKALAKAQLRQLDSAGREEISPERNVTVQFNPETLKVSFTNHVVTPPGIAERSSDETKQFVGAGVSTLAVQLWFDVTASTPAGGDQLDDVRRLTQNVAYFITPEKTAGNPPQYVPRLVRFLWGSFQFDGIMESLEETLELFSADGKPLRASINIVISLQHIRDYAFRKVGESHPRVTARRRPKTKRGP